MFDLLAGAVPDGTVEYMEDLAVQFGLLPEFDSMIAKSSSDILVSLQEEREWRL